jgi:hypothetical protein
MRVDLHNHITNLGSKVNNDNLAHTDYQQELIDTINDLNKKLENEKQKYHKKNRDHQREKEEI